MGAAIFRQDPPPEKIEQMKAWGFEEADFFIPAVQVWPENRDTTIVFMSLLTQWHVGMGGRTGLIYSEISPMLEMLDIEPERRKPIYHDLRVMEAGALEEIAKPKD